MSYLPRSTPSVRSTVLPGDPALHGWNAFGFTLMLEGVQGASQSSIVYDHQCSLSCTRHIVRWSWMCMQHLWLLTERVICCSFGISWEKLPFQSHGGEILYRTQVRQTERDFAGICPPQAVASQHWCSICEAVLCFSLVQGKKRGNAILSLLGSKVEPKGMCRHKQALCCST